MNMTMRQPLSYPFYMGSQRPPWSSVPYRLPPPSQQHFHSLYQTPRPPFALPQQPNPYSNTRYNHLKKSTSNPNRRSAHRSFDTSLGSHRYAPTNYSNPSYQYRPSKTKSVSDIKQMSHSSSTHLSKAQSWHAMTNPRQPNLSVSYAQEISLTPKSHRKRSSKRKKMHPKRQLPSSPKRRASFNHHRKRTIKEIPECGIVRISTLDEMPLPNNPTPKRNNSVNNDRLSNKGSISNSSKRPTISTGNNPIQNRKIKTNNEETRIDFDGLSSSSSSCSSRSSLQQRFNGSLRNDPLIISAMKDFRQLRRAPSHNSSLTRHPRRDSLCSDSTIDSSSVSHSNNSQSSFTSVERSEIRHMIKKSKTKGPQTSTSPLQSSPVPSSIQSKTKPSRPIIKPKKSSITEELDREFGKLRSLEPDQELNYVIPSSICKRKKAVEKPSPSTPPLPTFSELLRQVQLRPVEKLSKSTSQNFTLPTPSKEILTTDVYENPLSLIPVPRSSPIPLYEPKPVEIKHEYATPIKKKREEPPQQISHFQPVHNSNYCKPLPDIVPEKRESSFSYNSRNLLPTTFQPNRILNNQNGITNVTENIYTSDIELHLPSAITDKNEENSLEIHLENQTILTDYSYSDYELKQTTTSSSILDDFSRLFTRKHGHKNKFAKKSQRCSIM